MEIKVSDSEFIVMEILWRDGKTKASRVAEIAKEEIGWEKNTTYTFINRLIKKGAIKRSNPNFICEPILQKNEVIRTETKTFIDKMYGGSLNLFVKAFLKDQKLSDEELKELKQMIDSYK